MARSDVHEMQAFTWRGATGPFELMLGPGVFTPTRTSMVLAEALEIRPGDTVLDVGCGSGVLSFVAARLGAGRVIGCDISEQAAAVARHNAVVLGLDERVEFRTGDLCAPALDVAADVAIGDVSGIPDAVAAATGWFPGGPTGAELPVAMLRDMGPCIKPGGRLYLPTGTIQAEQTVLEAAREAFGQDNVQEVARRSFPLPGEVGRSEEVARLMDSGTIALERRGSRLLWRLSIWRCTKPA